MFHVKHFEPPFTQKVLLAENCREIRELKDNEKNTENRFIFMEKGKSMFHVKHFLDNYPEK